MKYDLEAAHTFLSKFKDLITFQTFGDKKKHDYRKLTRVFHGLTDENLEKCAVLNRAGAGIFFMVNQGDGQGRASENVKRIRAIFLDCDSDGDNVLDRVGAADLKPHIIVQTSPGKYHIYYIVEQFPIEEFSTVQKSLAANFGTDVSVSDLPRVMRLPGFYHQKGEPHQVSIVETSDHPPYSLNDFKFAAERGTSPSDKDDSKNGQYRNSISMEGVAKGKRNREIFRYACSRIAKGYKGGEVWTLVRQKAAACIPPLPETEAEKCLDSALKYQDDIQFFNGTKFIPHALIKYIRMDHDIFNDGTDFYEYNGSGVWLRVHRLAVGKLMRAALGKKAQNSYVEGALKLLEFETYKGVDDLPHIKGLINLANGMLDVENGALLPHDRDYFSKVQIPFKFDPKSKCPRFENFLKEIFPDDLGKIETLQEFAGYCLYPKIFIHKCLFLIGAGANGKSVLLNTISSVLGTQNVCAIDLHQLGQRFMLIELKDKLLNVSTEIQTRSPVSDNILKQVISGDPISAEKKHKGPVVFRPIAKHIFSMNEMPVITDRTHAFRRRLIVLKFNRIFNDKDQDRGLEDKLFSELPGILNWGLEGLRRVLSSQNITIGKQCKADTDNFLMALNPVRMFVDEECGFGNRLRVGKVELYRAYCKWSEESGHRALSKPRFDSQLMADFSSISVDTHGVRAFKGISLRRRGEAQATF